ncbi:MAG: haloacid dehalogenase type II [Burkholderiaceae bacterium]|jgi:2-haloacid dehalogenase|nr:haloacid dehalogenase type II [Burkholderiaceae bacterium]
MTDLRHIRALLFDVFGSVVDWRGSITRDLTAWGLANGTTADWEAFARDWRSHYQPNLEEVRSGRRPFALLDTLHREALNVLLEKYGIHDLSEHQKDHVNSVWHRLDAWPDSVPGLLRLKAHFTIAPLSNGNVSLLNNMAKHAALPWDLNLSTQWFKAYKPMPETYLGAVQALGLEPEQVMMCAAHNDDLKAAQEVGLKTAFWPRPTEYGLDQNKDMKPTEPWHIVAKDIRDLADQLIG